MNAASLTAADVAADLHYTRATVTAYLASGRIPGGFQPVDGGRWLVDAATYEAWKASRQTRPDDPHRIPPRSERSRSARTRRTA